MTSHRKLAAILFADIVGYTTMMQADEVAARQTVDYFEEVLGEKVREHHGQIFQYYGDGSLCLFPTASDAVRCALAVQRIFQKEPRVPLRIGIHIGEVLTEGKKIFGMGVNVAARIESLGKAGTVLFSSHVCEKIRGQRDFDAVSLGEFAFKNVDKPIEIFALSNDGLPVPEIDESQSKGRHLDRSKAHRQSKMSLPKIILFAVLAVAGAWFLYEQKPPDILESEEVAKSIAVLPFDNYSSEEEYQYFADAVSDEIRSQLLEIQELRVISRSSSRHYKGLNLPAKEIGDELGVAFILDGSVQRSSESVKVNIELSNTRTDQLEWSSPTFERTITDLFHLENEIAQEVVKQLSVRLSEREQTQLNEVGTKNARAYDAFLKGQEFLHRGRGRKQEIDSAVALFKEAISIDPDFNRAHINLANAWLDYLFWGRMPARAAVDSAFDAIFRATETESGEYYGVLGAINFYRFEKEPAKRMLLKALNISNNYIEAYFRLAWIYRHEGRFEEAIDLLQEAQSLDPLSTRCIGAQGVEYYYAGKYQKGIDIIEKELITHPNDNFLLWILGYLQTGAGDHDKAIETFRSRSAGAQTNWMLGYNLGITGDTAGAREVLDFLLARREEGYVPGFMIATVYMGLREYEKALDWLETDIAEGGQGHFIWGLKLDKKFDPLHGNPRFEAVCNVIH